VFSHFGHDSNLILKLILLNYQNNDVGRSNQLLEHQNFFAASLVIFKVLTKLFSDLYPAKF